MSVIALLKSITNPGQSVFLNPQWCTPGFLKLLLSRKLVCCYILMATRWTYVPVAIDDMYMYVSDFVYIATLFRISTETR